MNVVCEDIDSFTLEYLDSVTGESTNRWDSTQAADQFMRLPLQVSVVLTLKGGIGDQPLVMRTKTPIAMQSPISFAATQR